MTITTQELEEKFLDIIKCYVDLFKEKPFKSPFEPLRLILMKIASNLFSGNILWSRGRFDDAKIIIRGAFESLVLFDYLLANEAEIQRYIRDAGIVDFKNHIGFFNRNYSDSATLAKHYTELPEDIQKILPLKASGSGVIGFEIETLDKFLKSYKMLAQQTWPMIRKLVEAKTPNAADLESIALVVYGMNSQIAHGSFETLVNTYQSFPSEGETMEALKECNRQSVFILYLSINSLKSLLDSFDAGPMWEKIRGMYEYLGYDLSQYEQQENQPISNIIHIVTTGP